MMQHQPSLSLFNAVEQDQLSIPRYAVKLVRESTHTYPKTKILGAQYVSDFLSSIGIHDNAVEEFYTLHLNTKNQVNGMEMISRGTLNASLVHSREVFKGAILNNANSIIIAHNHPSGNVEPSNADKAVTEMLVKAGALLDIKVVDHVIVGSEGKFFSFRDAGLIIQS